MCCARALEHAERIVERRALVEAQVRVLGVGGDVADAVLPARSGREGDRHGIDRVPHDLVRVRHHLEHPLAQPVHDLAQLLTERGEEAVELRGNGTLRYRHSCFVASAAPAESVSSFAHAMSGWMRPPNPQSVDAITFSRPT